MQFDVINDYNKSLTSFIKRGKTLTTKEDLANLVVPVAANLLNRKVELDSCYHENMEFFANNSLMKYDSDILDIDENNASKKEKEAKDDAIKYLQKLFSDFYNHGIYTRYNSDIDVLNYMSYKRSAINSMIKQIPLIRNDSIRSSEFYSIISYLIMLVQSELIRCSSDEKTNLHSIVTAEEPIVIRDFSDNMLNAVTNAVMKTICDAIQYHDQYNIE